MTTTQPRKLVRLRTAPMPDPGEWCLLVGPAQGAVKRCSMYVGAGSCRLDTDDSIPDCADRFVQMPDGSKGFRRPQECIDAAEDVET